MTGVCRVRAPAPGKLNRPRPRRLSPDIIKDNVCNMRTGDDSQIAPPPRRVQIGFFCRKAHAVFLRHLIIGKPVLTGTVIVRVLVIAAAFCRFDHPVEAVIAVAQLRNIQRSATAMKPVIIPGKFSMFGFAELRKDVVKPPPAIAALRPFIIIGGLAAHIQHRIDG